MLGLHSVGFPCWTSFIWQSWSRWCVMFGIHHWMDWNKEQSDVKGQGDSRWDVLLVPLLGIRSSGTKGWPTWVVCAFISVEGTSHHEQNILAYLDPCTQECNSMSTIFSCYGWHSWWEKDIAGVFMDAGAWRLWCPKQIKGLGQPNLGLGIRLKSPTSWWWASGTRLHSSQIPWLITVWPPGTVSVINLIIHQTFLRKILRIVSEFISTVELEMHSEPRVWENQSPKCGFGEQCFRPHLCTLLVIYLLELAHFPVV